MVLLSIMDIFWPLTPFVIAALVGLAWALIELLDTFRRNIGSALRNRWGWAILGLNAAFPVVVYAIAWYIFHVGGIWTALIVGSTFRVILQSRFTIYRKVGARDETGLGDFSLRLDRAYQALQEWCYEEVNILLAEERAALAEALKRKLNRQQMEAELRALIASQPMEANRLRHQAKLEDILQQYQRESDLHHALALLLIEVSTPQRIRKLVEKIE
jgi:hypothetical protein